MEVESEEGQGVGLLVIEIEWGANLLGGRGRNSKNGFSCKHLVRTNNHWLRFSASQGAAHLQFFFSTKGEKMCSPHYVQFSPRRVIV